MLRWISSLFLLLALGVAQAADNADTGTTFSYSGCVDAARKPVPAQAEPGLAKFAEARVDEQGKPTIYYNPKALPQLLPETRLFLFAQECARVALKQVALEERTPEQLQAADCWALDTLSRSRTLSARDSIDAVMLELAPEATDVWAQVGSEPRTLQLDACPRHASRGNLTVPGQAGMRSDKWDACIQSCGAKLYSCGRSASCQSTYNACSAACDKK